MTLQTIRLHLSIHSAIGLPRRTMLAGRVVASIDPQGIGPPRVYDLASRVIGVINALGYRVDSGLRQCRA